MVLELIKRHIAVYVDARDRLRKLNKKPEATGMRAELKRKLTSCEKRKDKVNELIRNIYEDFRDGVLSEDEYLSMKAGYVAEIEKLDADMTELSDAVETYSPSYAGDCDMAEAFTKYIGVETLSREVVEAFIKKITCYDKETFDVEYTFTDKLQELIDLAKQRGADVA